MRPTSRSRANRTGFTYVEVSAVLILMILLAAAVVPNFVRFAQGQESRDFREGLVRIVSLAREQAISTGQTTTLEFAEESGQLQLVGGGGGDDAAGALSSLGLPDGVSAENYQANGGGSSEAEWAIRFFPDGASEPGGIEFSENGASFSLAVDEEGRARVVDGQIPDLKIERWPAGDYEQRI